MQLFVDTENLQSVIAFLVAVLTAIYGWYTAWNQNRQKKEVIAFYSDPLAVPATEVISPEVMKQLPVRSYLMSSSTKRWLLFDATSENVKLINEQITAAEQAQLTKYRINFIGGWYDIEWGLQYGGSGNPSGK